jgi:hypothetical protein
MIHMDIWYIIKLYIHIWYIYIHRWYIYINIILYIYIMNGWA